MARTFSQVGVVGLGTMGAGITCVQLDYDALRGMDSSTPTLF